MVKIQGYKKRKDVDNNVDVNRVKINNKVATSKGLSKYVKDPLTHFFVFYFFYFLNFNWEEEGED